MNRRALLQGIIGASAALVLPPTLAENAEATRRYWTGYGAGRWDDGHVVSTFFEYTGIYASVVEIIDYAFDGSLDLTTREVGVLMPNGMFYTSMQSEGVYVELAR